MVSSKGCQEAIHGAKSDFLALLASRGWQTDVQSSDRNQLTSAETAVISGPERVRKLSYTDIYHIGVREESGLRRFGETDLRSLGRIAAECIQPTRPIPHKVRL